MSAYSHRSRWIRWPLRALLLVLGLLLGPIGVLIFGGLDLNTHWSEASAATEGLAPAPKDEPEALVQIYGARAYSWRGAFAIHTWIATKRPDAGHYLVYQMIGWNLYRGRSTVTVSRVEQPDFRWFNASPELLAEQRGPNTDALIDRIESAVRSYPYRNDYRVWPGPNSNIFTAYVARKVPELGLDLPPTAIGKDYLVGGKFLDTTPSGSGWQVSLFGLLGLGLAWEEGIELDILGLSAGIDLNDLALRLPGIDRLPALTSG